MIDAGSAPILRCLGYFAQVFKENEGVELARGVRPDELVDILSTVSQADPLLPLWESLAGYSAHMLLGDNDLAELLVEDAYKRAPHLSLNLDHLAVLKMMRGDLEGAEAAFQRCLKVGSSSPWQYTYHVTGSMISMAKGDFRRSLLYANQALLRKPSFIGALRYAMVGFALTGRESDAKRMHAGIRRLRPDYDLGAWTQNMIRRTPRDLGTTLADSLKNNGFI